MKKIISVVLSLAMAATTAITTVLPASAKTVTTNTFSVPDKAPEAATCEGFYAPGGALVGVKDGHLVVQTPKYDSGTFAVVSAISGTVVVTADLNLQSCTVDTTKNTTGQLLIEGKDSAGNWFLNKQTRIDSQGKIGWQGRVIAEDFTFEQKQWYRFAITIDFNNLDAEGRALYSAEITKRNADNTADDGETIKVISGERAPAASNLTQFGYYLGGEGELWLDNFSIVSNPAFEITAPAENSVAAYDAQTGKLDGNAVFTAPSGFSSLNVALNGEVFETITAESEEDAYTVDLSKANNVNAGAANKLTVTAVYADGVKYAETTFYAAGKSVVTDMIVSANFNEVTQEKLDSIYETNNLRYNVAGYFTVGDSYKKVAAGFGSKSNARFVTQGKGALYTVNGPDGEGDMALEFRHNQLSTGGHGQITIDGMNNWLITDRYVFEIDTKINTAGNAVRLEWLFAPNAPYLFQPNGYIYGDKVKYVPGEWKTLKIEMDHKANIGYIYYDGQLASTYDIAQRPSGVKFELQSNTNPYLEFAVDNVKFYDITGESVEPYLKGIGYTVADSGVIAADAYEAEIPAVAKTIELTMSEAIDENTPVKVTYISRNEKTVSGEAVINGNSISIPITVENLRAGTEYTIKVGDITKKFTPYASGIKVTGNAAEYTFFSASNKTADLIIAGYDADGALADVKVETVALTIGNNTNTLSLDGDYAAVKAFCWNSLEDMKPVKID